MGLDAGARVSVLVAAAGASWESQALQALGRDGIVVLSRCVDLADLLATASAGQADAAVVSPDLPGLDNAAVAHLLRFDVRTVAVTEPGADAARLGRIGIGSILPATEIGDLPDRLRIALATDPVPDPEPQADLPVTDQSAPSGRVVTVWGGGGAPGRTTIAAGLAAVRASLGQGPVILADVDPYHGDVGQHLGVLDEVSGLLAAARLANTGELDLRRFATCRRAVAPNLEVLTGLPRADRWIEVREGIVDQILATASAHADVVVDTGFSLEDDASDFGRAGGGRNRMTREAVQCADEVIVVGAADPVGLSRLARALVELGDLAPLVRPHVVVNRMRDSLGWGERDIRGMVEGFSRAASVHFTPEDRTSCDRALVGGISLVEAGDSALRRSLTPVVDVVWPGSVAAPSGRRMARGGLLRRR